MKQALIQARVSKETLSEIEYLKIALGFSKVTDIVTYALHHLAEEQREQAAKKSPYELLEEMEALGSIEAPKDLSANYKTIVTKSLAAKHGTKRRRHAKKPS